MRKHERSNFPFLMKSIGAGTTAAAAMLAAAYLVFPEAWLLAAAITFGTTAYHMDMRLAVGFLIPKLTGYDFDYRAPWFRPGTGKRLFTNFSG